MITAALCFYFTHFPPQDPLDNEDLLDRVIADLYDVEMSVFMLKDFGKIALNAVRTNATQAFVDVPEGVIPRTFTRPNVAIKIHNIHVNNLTAGAVSSLKIVVDGETELDGMILQITGTTVRSVTVSGRFLIGTLGVSKNIRLQFQAVSGTVNLTDQVDYLLEIEEWD